MKDHTGCERAFHQSSRAWYTEHLPLDAGIFDEFMVGMYHPEGGSTGEFKIIFQNLGGDIVPRLCAYDDSWDALFNMGDLLESMADADDKNISPEEFRKLLVLLGFKDITSTERTR